ncbi:acetate kinase [Xenococcus sp. PCC 7305]|uniref:acetate kinase n=1 Tax=Xenococcus sp. PCC 7305 TaxID=102125 RepID=UPI0002AC9C01|nr:acetate kinase [Xenococcus sp. PCC 7305]ELS04687.1 acetate kinase [Xenococcus sp. PCC 7305]
MKILVMNAGSSSQKSCLYELTEDILPTEPPEPLWEAHIDWTIEVGFAVGKIKANGVKLETKLETSDRGFVLSKMLETLTNGATKVIEKLSEIDIVGHRVVHGGTEYSQATRITSQVKDEIARFSSLAPAHNPANLGGIEAIENILGDIPQLAVFDTAFHSQIPSPAAVYPIPYQWLDKGVRRYGFHGISHQYCSHRVAQLLDKPLDSLRIITCHLGNGCSLAAVKNGRSIDTTMGFTPLEGLMMGSRSGSIDPGILIYLMREYDFNADQLDKMLNKESGLKGVSGLSADMRTILAALDSNKQAKLAFESYIHQLRSLIGSMLASLGGLDVLAFTAGVGENASLLREKACEGWDFLGLQLDIEKNNSSPQDVDIAAADSAVRIFVIQAQEDWAIAKECWKYFSEQ